LARQVKVYIGGELSRNWIMYAKQLDVAPREYPFVDLEVRPIAIPGKIEPA